MENFEKRLSDLLSAAVPNGADLAKDIAVKFGSFLSLCSASLSELTEMCGERAAVLIRLVAAIASRRVTDAFKFGKAHSEKEIIEFLIALYLGVENETVYLLTMDSCDRVTSLELVGEGTVNASGILPRKLIEIMVDRRAKKAIIAHNHPGGRAICSHDDVKATKKLAALFKSAEKELLCHYIVAGNDVSSVPFKDNDSPA